MPLLPLYAFQQPLWLQVQLALFASQLAELFHVVFVQFHVLF